MKTLSAVFMFAALPLLAALAADKPLTPANPAGAPGSIVSIQGYGDYEKTCQEWTDGCRTCLRSGSGESACSNIGPACQPAAITCARRAAPTK